MSKSDMMTNAAAMSKLRLAFKLFNEGNNASIKESERIFK